MDTYLLVFVRLVSIMALLLIATLFVMGKRPIGELPVFDFLVLIVMGSIVGADIADPDIEHLPTAFAIVVLACVQRFFSFLSMRFRKFRKIITFEPTVILHNGKLIHRNIKRIHYSVDEILMLLRERSIFDIDAVEYGIIEANGKLSVLKRPQHEQATLQDMKIAASGSNAAVTIILDGNLQEENLKCTGFSEIDIQKKLKAIGYRNIQSVFFASLDSDGKMNVSSYQEKATDLFTKNKGMGPAG